MTPEQFERKLRFINECAGDHRLFSIAQASTELAKAYRAIWQNRVPEEATLISCPGSEGAIVLLYVHDTQWIVCSQGKSYAAAATPALALEEWRKENKG